MPCLAAKPQGKFTFLLMNSIFGVKKAVEKRR
jgi:hypothetical protein